MSSNATTQDATLIIPRYYPARIDIHRTEVPKYSKRQLKFLSKLDFTHASCNPLFKKMFRSMDSDGILLNLIDSALEAGQGSTSQMELFTKGPSTSPYYNVGDEVEFRKCQFASPDPNDMRNSMGRDSSTIFRIENPSMPVIAIPSSTVGFQPLYIFDKRTIFVITGKETQNWSCKSRVSCPVVHNNVTVISITPRSETGWTPMEEGQWNA